MCLFRNKKYIFVWRLCFYCLVPVIIQGCSSVRAPWFWSKSFSCSSLQPSPATPLGGVRSIQAGKFPYIFNLLTVPSSNVPFAHYDIKSGMNYSYGFAVHDFDCDGRPDVSFFDSYSKHRNDFMLPRGATGYIQWNRGDLERITRPDTYPEIPQPPSDVILFERHIALDINGDELPDIVGVLNSHAAVVAYLNPGSRSTTWRRKNISTTTPGAVNITSGDMDGDGDADLIVSLRRQPSTDSNPIVTGLVWLENPGTSKGGWQQHSINGSADLIDPRTLSLADIDGDGKLDVVTTDATTGIASWFGRDTEENWVRHNIDVSKVKTSANHYGMTADVDQDGKIDILIPVWMGIALLRNVDGGITWETIRIASFLSEPFSLRITEVTMGDIDLDGNLDILFSVGSTAPSLTDPRRGGIYWLRQGHDSWEAYRILYEEDMTVGVKLFDFDNDGDLDIISNTEYQRNAITLWINKLR